MGVDTALKGAPNILQSFEIIKTGRTSVTKPINDTAGQSLVVHDLGFAPLAFVFVTNATSNFSSLLPSLDLTLAGGAINLLYDAVCNEKHLQISIQSPTTSSSYGVEVTEQFIYYLVKQKST